MNTKFSFLAILVLPFFLLTCGNRDDDGTPTSSTPNISINSVSKFEGNETNSFEFKVRLDKESDQNVSVDYSTNDLSAIASDDYLENSGSLTFAPSEIEKSIFIEIVTDTLKEGDEEFLVILSNPVNGILSTTSGTGTIRNDDDFFPQPDDGYLTPESYSGYTLVWQDEFNGTTLDPECWTHELGGGGWGNQELQNYTASSDNSYLSDGKLIIEAREETSGGNAYSSARLITAGKKEFSFGRVDIRAKLPKGQGIWPALWMLGSNIFDIGWPACGEIDIMELVGHEPNKIHGTAHWGPQGQSWSFNAGNAFTLQNGDYGDEFHVFSIIWGPNSIKWYRDDLKYFEINHNTVGANDYPFNQDFFFIFNIAVGGVWPGSPDASTVFPQRMIVDYIRVFQE